MPEIKNTFLKSKMNKDLDSRIIPNGEYRDGQNISISTSEGADVGALENIRGNSLLSSMGINGVDIECIGTYSDVSKNRIYIFSTNNNEQTSTEPPQLTTSGSSSISTSITLKKLPIQNYISYIQLDNDSNVVDSKILVGGNFLNFSKDSKIYNVNLIEDLLFWTDNRNQPRKINVETAISNSYFNEDEPGYYSHEDHISVAKYAPYSSINFLKSLDNEDPSKIEKTLKNQSDEFMPPFLAVPVRVRESDFFGTNFLSYNNDSSPPPTGSGKDDAFTNLINYLSDGNNRGRPNFSISGNFDPPTRDFFNFTEFPDTAYKIKVNIQGQPSAKVAYVDRITNNTGVFLQDEGGTPIGSFKDVLGWEGELPADANTGIGGNFVVQFSLQNPDFDISFAQSGVDEDFLKSKFVRFSYRFKYDDNEYSLIAPFSQHAFVPKQFGYFLGDDENRAKKSGIVSFMENQITTAGLVIDLPCAANEMFDKLKAKELQILYKASDEQALKVVTDIGLSNFNSVKGIPKTVLLNNSIPSNNVGYAVNQIYKTEEGSGKDLTIKVTGIGASGNITTASVAYSGYGYTSQDTVKVIDPNNNSASAYLSISSLTNTIIYDYNSQKPIKVLPENEIVRVSDIVPIRAKTQEAIGNRIVYGNFMQSSDSLDSLKYNVSYVSKSTNNSIELNNSTLKQGRSYQVGVVLQDRYGRSSNVILENNDGSFNSTFFSPYTDGDGDPTSWHGNSILFKLSEKIKENVDGDYYGVWSEKNPMGWYSYKIVVKQEDQDYYNIYTPGGVSGNIKFTKWTEDLSYEDTEETFNFASFNDNINKIPRDLKEIGPSDNIYFSSIDLVNRVQQTHTFNTDFPNSNNQNSSFNERQDITNIKPFRELGDWTIYKGVNLKYTTIGPAAVRQDGEDKTYDDDTYIYPGNIGEVDPFFLDNNKNPIITTLSTTKRLGAKASDQEVGYHFAKELMVFETKPTRSNLDIYYETSTSGLISDLNFSFDNDQSNIGGLSDISFVSLGGLQEQLEYPVDISNSFGCVDSSGNFLTDPTVEIKINNVVEKFVDDSGSTITNNMLQFPTTNPPTPPYLSGRGWLSGNFFLSDVSNPFQLSIVSPATPSSSPRYRIQTRRPLLSSKERSTVSYDIELGVFQNGVQVLTKTFSPELINNPPKIGNITMPEAPIRPGGVAGLIVDRFSYIYKNHWSPSNSDINDEGQTGTWQSAPNARGATNNDGVDLFISSHKKNPLDIIGTTASFDANEGKGYSTTIPGRIYGNSRSVGWNNLQHPLPTDRVRAFIAAVSYSTNGSEPININSNGVVIDSTTSSVNSLGDTIFYGSNSDYLIKKEVIDYAQTTDSAGNAFNQSLLDQINLDPQNYWRFTNQFQNSRLANLEYKVIDGRIQRVQQYWNRSSIASYDGGLRPLSYGNLTLGPQGNFGFASLNGDITTTMLYVDLPTSGGPLDWPDGAVFILDIVAIDNSMPIGHANRQSDPYRIKCLIVNHESSTPNQ